MSGVSDVAEAVEPAAGHDAGQLRLRLPAVDRAAADRDVGDVRVHPGALHACWCRDRPEWARRIWWSALGVRAIEQGFSVAFYRLEDLLHEMRKDATVSPQALRRKKYFNVSYLVVDEVGFEPMSRQDASLFFRLVSYRYRRGSTAITTNKSVKDWPGILAGDEAMAAAILDRLLHKSVVLNVRGRSYRLQELEKVLK